MTTIRRILNVFSWMDNCLFQDGIDATANQERVERELEITIRDGDAVRLKTPEDLCGYIAAQRRESGRPLDDEKIWNKVREITSEEFGVAVADLHPRIGFVEDLGC